MIITSFLIRCLQDGQWAKWISSNSDLDHFSPRDKFTESRCQVKKFSPHAGHCNSMSWMGDVILVLISLKFFQRGLLCLSLNSSRKTLGICLAYIQDCLPCHLNSRQWVSVVGLVQVWLSIKPWLKWNMAIRWARLGLEQGHWVVKKMETFYWQVLQTLRRQQFLRLFRTHPPNTNTHQKHILQATWGCQLPITRMACKSTKKLRLWLRHGRQASMWNQVFREVQKANIWEIKSGEKPYVCNLTWNDQSLVSDYSLLS